MIGSHQMMENGFIKQHIEVNSKNMYIMLLSKTVKIMSEIFKECMTSLY